MRKLLAGMRVSLDGKIEGSEGYADWVDSWFDVFNLMPRVDACLLGGGMYPNYEEYWSAVDDYDPAQPLPITGTAPTPDERAYARFATQTPHYVLSRSLTSAQWPKTRFVRSLDDVAALKQQPGKDIYLIGGAQTTASLLDAGLVDELNLLLYPLLVGAGKALFASTAQRRGLELQHAEPLPDGRISLTYGIC